MVALFAFDPAQKQWIPVDVKPKLCHLILHAQWCERQGLETMMQLAIFPEVCDAPSVVDDLPL